MSTAPAQQTPKKKDSATKSPPEERFWKRYSPHGEAPLSAAGSIILHALSIGGLILMAVYFSALFVKPAHELPVSPVRLDLSSGGGGGPKDGGGTGTRGLGGRVEDVGESAEVLPPELQEEPRRPALNPVEKAQIAETFDNEAARFIQESNSESTKAFARLTDGVRRKLSDNLNPSRGKGGSGGGGGQGTGQGTGVGSGRGEGKMALSKREKRMLRWHMRFTAASGEEYLSQLRGLGAKLAFPLGDRRNPDFYVVEKLIPGEQAVVKDVAQFNAIYWIDDKPNSVRDILAALRLQLPEIPNEFVAFMPKAIEDRLFELERNYVVGVLRRPFDEDKIEETIFRVVPKGGKYVPELTSVLVRD